MRLIFSITDFISKKKGLVPIINTRINGDNTASLLSDKEDKASVQCERFERLAKEINALIEGFYREEVINSQPVDKV